MVSIDQTIINILHYERPFDLLKNFNFIHNKAVSECQSVPKASTASEARTQAVAGSQSSVNRFSLQAFTGFESRCVWADVMCAMFGNFFANLAQIKHCFGFQRSGMPSMCSLLRQYRLAGSGWRWRTVGTTINAVGMAATIVADPRQWQSKTTKPCVHILTAVISFRFSKQTFQQISSQFTPISVVLIGTTTELILGS